MIVIPAIDIRGGRVVRLAQGKADRQTVYSGEPVDVARAWADKGAGLLHVVDLDGAIDGKFNNLESIKKMAAAVDAGIELGGGLRDEAVISDLLSSGIKRVVVGTRAVDKEFLGNLLARFAERIVAGLDARDGFVYTKGWTSKTNIRARDLVRDIAGMGVKTVIYTDISQDGMLKGPNIEGLKEILAAAEIDVIASGGISDIEDVKRLKALESDGLTGMIIGKALYEKRIDLKEAISICLA